MDSDTAGARDRSGEAAAGRVKRAPEFQSLRLSAFQGMREPSAGA